MTEIKVVREDEKATAILKAIRHIDDGAELAVVVRCKDCVYGEFESDGMYFCRYNGGDWNGSDHFCSYGERKDNG